MVADDYDTYSTTISFARSATCSSPSRLFVVWGILTLIGVIVDQGKDPSIYFGSYPAPIARAILRLSFDNIYHSPWYVGIIGLILTVAGGLHVQARDSGAPAAAAPGQDRQDSAARERRSAAATQRSVRERVDGFFRARGWQFAKREFGGNEWTLRRQAQLGAARRARRAHRLRHHRRRHDALLGARLFGRNRRRSPGNRSRFRRPKRILRLDDFAYTITPMLTKSGMVYQPIDYVSHVTVTGNDGVPKAMTVRVNHPIDVDGTLYYQASYGFAMRFRGHAQRQRRVRALAARRCSKARASTFPARGAP